MIYAARQRVNHAALAVSLHRAIGLDCHASPFAFADRCRVDFVPCASARNGAELVGRVIYWNASVEKRAQLRAFAREMCRWLCSVREVDPTDENALALARIMFPTFFAHVSQSDRSSSLGLLPLRRVEPQASASLPAHLGRPSALSARLR